MDPRIQTQNPGGISIANMRKTYSAEFKARVVLEILKEEKAIAQISSEYGSHASQLTKEHGNQISMDGRGRAIDNIFTERLWRSVKLGLPDTG